MSTSHFSIWKHSLQAVQLRNDNLESFRTRFWAMVSQQRETPSPILLENLYVKQLRRSEAFKDTLKLYELSINHQGRARSIDYLDEMLVKHLDACREERIAPPGKIKSRDRPLRQLLKSGFALNGHAMVTAP